MFSDVVNKATTRNYPTTKARSVTQTWDLFCSNVLSLCNPSWRSSAPETYPDPCLSKPVLPLSQRLFGVRRSIQEPTAPWLGCSEIVNNAQECPRDWHGLMLDLWIRDVLDAGWWFVTCFDVFPLLKALWTCCRQESLQNSARNMVTNASSSISQISTQVER